MAALRARLLIIALAVVTSGQAACTRVFPCRDGTLFVDVNAAAATGADQLLVEVHVGDKTLQGVHAFAGQSSTSIEVTFPSGYPAGQSVSVTITAESASVAIARGTTTVTLPNSCAHVSTSLSSVGSFDLGTTIEDSGSAPDAGTDMGDGTVPALFTEDFEAGSLSAGWKTNLTNGSVTVDNSLAHRGSYSLHVHHDALSPPTIPNATVDITETTTVPLPDMYLRAFVYVPSSPAPDATSTAIMSVEQNVSPFHGMNFNLENGSFGSFDNVPSTPVSAHASTPLMPLGTWACIEWNIHVSSTNGYIKAYLGGSVAGTEITSLSMLQATQPSPTIGVIGFGLISYPNHSVPARDVWFDDIAVSNNPIGCTQ